MLRDEEIAEERPDRVSGVRKCLLRDGSVSKHQLQAKGKVTSVRRSFAQHRKDQADHRREAQPGLVLMGDAVLDIIRFSHEGAIRVETNTIITTWA